MIIYIWEVIGFLNKSIFYLIVIYINRNILLENKITNIINLNSEFSPNHFPDDFDYLSFNLYDLGKESISFYFNIYKS